MSPSARLSYSKFFAGIAANNGMMPNSRRWSRWNRCEAIRWRAMRVCSVRVHHLNFHQKYYPRGLLHSVDGVSVCMRHRVASVSATCPYVVCHLNRTHFTTIEIVSQAICLISVAFHWCWCFSASVFLSRIPLSLLLFGGWISQLQSDE